MKIKQTLYKHVQATNFVLSHPRIIKHKEEEKNNNLTEKHFRIKGNVKVGKFQQLE